MQKIKFLIVFSIILLATLACNALASPTSAPIPTIIIEVVSTPTAAGNAPFTEATVPRVSPEKAKVAQESGAAIIVDVRSKEAYDAEHITGSISIPLSDIEANPAGLKLDKDQWIITYCT